MSSKSLPTKFECGGRTIRVERIKRLAGRHGEWDSAKGLIRIVEQPDPQSEWGTFLHELVHCIRDTYGHYLPDAEAEECVVEGIAQGLQQFWRTATPPARSERS